MKKLQEKDVEIIKREDSVKFLKNKYKNLNIKIKQIVKIIKRD